MNNIELQPATGSTAGPLSRLSGEDQAFIVNLVLHSGSLKGLAEVYGVSYPTIRARLDKVIERLTGVIEGRPPDPLKDYLADLIRRGAMNVDTARRIAELAEQRDKSEGGDA